LSLVSSAVHADLQLVEDFEALTPLTKDSPDGLACSGVLGGAWDTQSNGTGNIDLASRDGSKGLAIGGNSKGNGRAVGFYGIDNPIDDGETGILFFRFMVRDSNNETRTFMGLISDTDDDSINSTSTDDPSTIPAGISLSDNNAGGVDMLTLDGATVLMSGLSRGQWYNIWFVANNTTDTFSLYLSEAEGPVGEVGLPTPDDFVSRDVPFTVATPDPLSGMIISNPNGTAKAETIFVDEVWWDGTQGLEAPAQARKPSPAEHTEDVATDLVLTWTPAEAAVTHNVYFGTDMTDVTDATVDDPRGVLINTDLDVNSVSSGALDLDTTYYWRVDEVNHLNPQSPWKGSVWSFTTEPVASELASANIAVVASSSTDTIQIPENTINGSGLNEEGGHGVNDQTMWLSSTDPNGAWVEYIFDKTYRMHDMQVWNHNTLNESTFGLGMKDVLVSYSTDGEFWTPMQDVNQLTQAPGEDGYQANTIIDLSGVVADRIRIDASANWGGLINKFGLSEVRFSNIPMTARLPQPAPGTLNLDPAAGINLHWSAGRETAQHVLYLGTDEQAVMDGTIPPMTLTKAEYLAANLDINSVYYWRVDEANEAESPGLWQGELWDFSTAEFLVLDDFEDYNSFSPYRPFQTWLDGIGYSDDEFFPVKYDGNGTGAGVGHDIWSLDSPHYEGDIMERGIRHEGSQSMPLYFNNGEAPFVSEATRVFASAQDWTGYRVNALGIWTLGFSDVGDFSFNSGDQTYAVSSAGGDIWDTADTCHFVYKKLSGNGEIVVKVESVDPINPWSKAGVMIRQGLAAGAPHGFVGVTSDNGVTFVVRSNADGDSRSNTVNAIQTPYWVKLVNESTYLSAFMSADGHTWEPIGIPEPIYLTGNADLHIGMAVSSHEGRDAAPCEAIFSNVSVLGAVDAGAFTQAAAITGDAINAPERLYAKIKDATGKQVEVELDPTGTVNNDWTLQQVDLPAIAGQVNLASVKALTLGIGNGTSGSEGLVLIDDVILFRAD